MPTESEIDFSTGVYRCKDISSIKIRVCLKTIESSSVPLTGLQEDIKDDNKFEEQVFSWQQRIFSQRQIKLYKDTENCKTDLHKEYHRQVLELDNNEKSYENTIFSYVSQDILQSGIEKDVLHYDCKINSYLSEAMRCMPSPNSKVSRLDIKDIPKENIVKFDLDLETFTSNYLSSSSWEFMYIMADISYLTEGESSEQVLVILRWEPSLQVLTVFPDFNDNLSGPGYILEGLSDACNRYIFWVSHFKADEGNDDKQYEKISFVDADFMVPALNTSTSHYQSVEVHFFGNIKTAQYFEYNNIFVNYYFDLPKGWTCSSPENLYGVTHRSKHMNGIFTLNHLFELHLILNISSNCENSGRREERFPQLLVEVISMDKWGRVCREGCGGIRLPPFPGRHTFTVNTWRPHTDGSRVESLRRYFIGGTSHLADRSYFGVPFTLQQSHLSKFGFGTVAAGKVDVDVNVILCTHSSRPSSFTHRIPSFFDHLSTTNLIQSVNIVLKAFAWAQKRMLQAAQPISPS